MVKENPIHKQQIEPVLMADRFPTYDLDGRLAADGAEVHMILSGLETQLAAAYWDAFNALPIVTRKIEGDLLESYIRGSARHMQTKYADAGGQEAATIACQNTHMALRVGLPIATVLSCIGESHKLAIHYVIEACAGDTARQTRLTAAINRLALLEMDIMLAYAEKLDRAAISQERQALASDFDRSIASLVQDSDGVRQQLAKQATSADHAARGMIAKTSEVAAASEQSAMAMREAASTAAGLIRAIEDARTEVEASASVATRASEQAGEAVAMSDRGGARGRIGPRLRGRGAGSEKPRQRNRACDRRYCGQDHRDPAGNARIGRRQPVDPADDHRSAAVGAADSRCDGRAGADGDLDHRRRRRNRARRRQHVVDHRQHPQRFGHRRQRNQRAQPGIFQDG